MKNSRLFVCILMAGLALACNPNRMGSGETISETRDLGDISRLKINGVFALFLSQSDMPSMRIEGSKDLADRLQVKQTGDLLELSLKDGDSGFFQNESLAVYLEVADLREFTFEGVGNIKTEGTLALDEVEINGRGVGNIKMDIEATRVEANLNLVGNMVLSGMAEEVVLINEGIGNVDASKLVSQNLDLNSSGIGRVAVNCENELSLQVNGIGAVEYYGDPKVVNEKVDGIGKVIRK